MAIDTTFLGSVRVTGEDAKSFSRKVTHARGTKAAAQAAANGRVMVSTFALKGVVPIHIKPTRAATNK